MKPKLKLTFCNATISASHVLLNKFPPNLLLWPFNPYHTMCNTYPLDDGYVEQHYPLLVIAV
ncbi:hypothetical protein Bpfe_011961, partial [Biomphalaria pfeifferi]